jgi:glycosyltransferase involved in cell wall biosynthesis
MLCYHYPPAISGGVERSVRFAKYLPQFGWTAAVLTTNRYGTADDRSGEEIVRVGELMRLRGRARAGVVCAPSDAGKGAGTRDAAPTCRVRAGASVGSRLRGRLVRAAEKWLLIPDKHVRWTAMAFIPALRMIRRGAVDAIYTTSPPASAHVLGLILKRLTGKPWIMDLRDPWTFEPLTWYLRAGGVRLSIERTIERICFKNANAIVTNTPDAESKYAELYPDCARKIHSIPNGFDAHEFEEARSSTAPGELLRAIGDDVFVISHIGTFSRHADTAAYPKSFLDAIARLVAEGVFSPRTCRVIFAGGIHPEADRRIAEYNLGGLLVETGPVPHRDALRIMLRSDLLLIYDPDHEGAYYIRGKLYEYLATGRWILGVLPGGATRTLLERSGHAVAVTRDDEMEIGTALRAAFRERHRRAPADFAISPYEGRHLTSMLADILDTMVR